MAWTVVCNRHRHYFISRCWGCFVGDKKERHRSIHPIKEGGGFTFVSVRALSSGTYTSEGLQFSSSDVIIRESQCSSLSWPVPGAGLAAAAAAAATNPKLWTDWRLLQLRRFCTEFLWSATNSLRPATSSFVLWTATVCILFLRTDIFCIWTNPLWSADVDQVALSTGHRSWNCKSLWAGRFR